MSRNLWTKKIVSVFLAGALCVCTPLSMLNASAEAAVDAGESQLGVKNAQLFDITYLDNGVKLLTDGEGSEKLLVPKETEIPEGYDDAMVIRTPVENVVYCSTTDVGMLKELGDESLYDTIAAVTTPVEYWTIQEVIDRLNSGEIAYIAQSETEAANIEEIATLNPDLVVIYAGELAAQMEPQLDELNIPYVTECLGSEESDEALMEWMKFYAALYNEDELADSIYEENLAKMDELMTAAQDVPEDEKPLVAYGMLFDGTVYTVGRDSRMAQTIERSGGIYALDLEGSGDVQISLEEFVDKARDADILIYSSLVDYTPDKVSLTEDADYGDPLLAEFRAYQNDEVFGYASDYYMSSAAVYEKFQDWIAMLHPELMEGYELKHFVRLPDSAE